MIKLTKENTAQVLTEKLNKLTVVKHEQGDSYDSDLVIWKRKKTNCNNIDDIDFIDFSTDNRHFLIRKKWHYEGSARLIPDFDLYCFKRNRGYVKINLKYYRDDKEFIWYTLSDSLNIVIKLLNFITINKANGITYEIYKFMRDVIKDYERLLKKGLI